MNGEKKPYTRFNLRVHRIFNGMSIRLYEISLRGVIKNNFIRSVAWGDSDSERERQRARERDSNNTKRADECTWLGMVRVDSDIRRQAIKCVSTEKHAIKLFATRRQLSRLFRIFNNLTVFDIFRCLCSATTHHNWECKMQWCVHKTESHCSYNLCHLHFLQFAMSSGKLISNVEHEYSVSIKQRSIKFTAFYSSSVLLFFFCLLTMVCCLSLSLSHDAITMFYIFFIIQFGNNMQNFPTLCSTEKQCTVAEATELYYD